MNIYHTLLALTLLGALESAHAQDTCRPLKQTDADKIDVRLARTIKEPGKYCLEADIKSPRLYDLHGEKNTGSPMLRIGSSNVEVDLREHAMIAETGGMSGVVLFDTDNHGKLPAHVSIRNGTVSTRTHGGLRLAFEEGSLPSDFMTKYSGDARFSDNAYKKLQQRSPDTYPLTENLIDTMKIEANTSGKAYPAGLVAVGMQGAGNIVRNSIIEITNGHAAVYLFGPNNIIENNIIIFKGKSAYESAAAIKLHHSNGTIVRNNDIIIRSLPGTGPDAAISVIDSKDVVIEDNRIYGVKTVARTWDGKSGTTERNNAIRSLLHAPK